MIDWLFFALMSMHQIWDMAFNNVGNTPIHSSYTVARAICPQGATFINMD